SEEPKFEVADSDMPQDQEENLGNDHEKPKEKTPQQGQNQRWLMTLASSAKKPSKTFYELMSTPIDFSAFIMNGLKINNLSQETLLGPAFRLLKGTRSNYAELEYDFEECYKALSEKLDWRIQKGFYTLSYNRPWDWLWAFHMTFNEDAQFEEVRRKTMRDFHKTHPTGSRDVKIIPSVKSEGTCVKPGVPNVTKEESSESEVESWGNNEDDSNNEQDSSGEDIDQYPNQENDSDDNKTQSDDENKSDFDRETKKNESGSESDQEEDEKGDEDDEEEIADKADDDEDEKMDYTTSQLYDNVDIRLNEPIDTDKGFKTEVPVTNSSHSSDLAAKFLNFSDIPHTDVEIVSPMDVHVHHEVPSQQTPTLLTVPVSVISNSSLVFSTVIPQSLPSFTSPP
ncbi:hypothetical protein Tco_1175258, partial [Tanacetum coccineum]